MGFVKASTNRTCNGCTQAGHTALKCPRRHEEGFAGLVAANRAAKEKQRQNDKSVRLSKQIRERVAAYRERMTPAEVEQARAKAKEAIRAKRADAAYKAQENARARERYRQKREEGRLKGMRYDAPPAATGCKTWQERQEQLYMRRGFIPVTEMGLVQALCKMGNDASAVAAIFG